MKRVRIQTTQLFEAQNLSGFVYTQLTDVEQELNGLMTYDRLLKAPLKNTAAVFEGTSRAANNTIALHDWLVLGPFPTGTTMQNADNSAGNITAIQSILDAEYTPHEAALQGVEGASEAPGSGQPVWKKVHIDGDVLDFQKVFGGQTDNAAVYATATFDSPREVRNVLLLFGSDDGANVWLNGQRVHTVAKIRGVSAGDETIANLTLKAGRNVLVVKVAQAIGGWGLSASFELPDEKAGQTK